jgi:metal-dependent hydrolase (beta-lactamase superfamily II)
MSPCRFCYLRREEEEYEECPFCDAGEGAGLLRAVWKAEGQTPRFIYLPGDWEERHKWVHVMLGTEKPDFACLDFDDDQALTMYSGASGGVVILLCMHSGIERSMPEDM